MIGRISPTGDDLYIQILLIPLSFRERSRHLTPACVPDADEREFHRHTPDFGGFSCKVTV